MPLFLLSFGRSGLDIIGGAVSVRRAVRAFAAARRRWPGSSLVFRVSALSLRGRDGMWLMSVTFPWARSWEARVDRSRDFVMGRLVLPVADFVAPRWAARRWPD